MSKAVIAAAFAAAMVAALATPAQADHPDGDGPSSCAEINWGKTAEVNGEHWICEYQPEVNDFLWDVADFLYDDEEDVSDDDEIDTGDAYTHLTRSRIEHLADGLHTGADDASYRNGARWRTRHLSENYLFYWDGSNWIQCGYTGRLEGSRSYVFGPTWGWNNACGVNMWYGTIANTWQWTGTYWHGNTSPWSGYIWFGCDSCLTSVEPTGAPIGVPTITAVPPTARPGRVKPVPASGAAIPVSLTVSAAVPRPSR